MHVQAARTIVRGLPVRKPGVEISTKELMIISEIGLEDVPTATSFVEYISERHGISQSGIWYTLKKLKGKGILDFAERGRGEAGKPLSLTKEGTETARRAFIELARSRSYSTDRGAAAGGQRPFY